MASIPREIGRLPFPTPRHFLDHGGRTPVCGIRVERMPTALPAADLLVEAGRSWRSSAPDTGPLVVDIDATCSGGEAEESYELRIRGAHATIRSAGTAGIFYAAQTLIAAVRSVSEPDDCVVPAIDVRDAPTLRWRGTVEGFYGPPWTHRARLRHLRFSGRHRLNAYVYAPKNDPYHRDRWRDPYPAAELARLAELADEAARHHVRFVYALAPGTSMRFCDPAENALLHAKAEQLRLAGVRSFALLFDDIPDGLGHSADLARFGTGPGAAGSAHGWVATQFAEQFLAPRGITEPLLVCPADYDGTVTSPYRTRLAAALPREAVVWWSGPTVVSPQVTSADVAAAAASYGRELLLWDNVPVNDFDRARVYLGPLRERPHDPMLVGITANPMIEALASQLTLACVAEYAWNPAGYDPCAAIGRAVHTLTGGELAQLVAACSGWPPDAPTGVQLASTVASALGTDPVEARAAAQALRAELAGLADVQVGTTELACELEPWREAGVAMARAGRAAAELLLRDSPEQARIRVEQVRRTLDDAESRPENVLRDTLSPFVRAVLHRFERPLPEGSGPVALLVSGVVPSAGEQALADLLRRHGFAVRQATAVDATAPLPELVVISRWADPAVASEVARVACPVLALAHPVEAGLATRSGVLLREQHVRIVAPGHALAGGRTGTVPVYRVPGMSRWAEPAPEATVVARGEEEPRPVVVHYPAGARLADGTTAPAPRATSFLGRDLLAPWLMTADGTDLVDAAIAALVPDRTAAPSSVRTAMSGPAEQRPTRTTGDRGIRRDRTDRGS